MRKYFAVAIDGPCGGGKSTVAKLVARALEYIYVDTGAMYRAVALACLRGGLNLDDEEQVSPLLEKLNISLKFRESEQKIYLNGEDVTYEIRSQPVADGASRVAALNAVRQKLTVIQKNIGRSDNVVMDGRDIGSHVLPDAQVKIYLDAQFDERVRRRLSELAARGAVTDVKKASDEMRERDYRDSHREFAPLTRCEDAIYIDATDMEPNEIADRIIALVREKQAEDLD